jgi:propionyl-CoA carboxylase alpha chain
VTELVTGIDLVEQMIRIAAGEKLSIAQRDVRLDGWAIETRVYAEDPTRDFVPSTGRLVRYRPPAERQSDGVSVRIDAGVAEGDEISLYYDPMIAKLVTHARTREQAIAAQADALDQFAIDGIRHNVPFLSALMQHPRFRAGKLSTAFLAEEYPSGFRPAAPAGENAHLLAAVAAAVDHAGNTRKRRIGGQMRFRPVTFERRRVVKLGERPLAVEVEQKGNAVTVAFLDADKPHAHALVSPWRLGNPVWSGTVDGDPVAVQVRLISNGADLTWRGMAARAYVYTPAEAQAAHLMPERKSTDSGRAVRCPMPGLVVSIAVHEGQEIKTGETLAVVEAMKMENVLRAERDGVVKKIHVKPGDTVPVDAMLLELV